LRIDLLYQLHRINAQDVETKVQTGTSARPYTKVIDHEWETVFSRLDDDEEEERNTKRSDVWLQQDNKSVWH
jgi:hypothetical protein